MKTFHIKVDIEGYVDKKIYGRDKKIHGRNKVLKLGNVIKCTVYRIN